MMENNFILRDVIASDLPIFFENQRDPQACKMAAFVAKDPQDRVAFDAHWTKIMADDSVFIQTIVVVGQVVGSVLNYYMFGEPEVAYWIGREFWGRGYATRSLALFLELQTARPLYARG